MFVFLELFEYFTFLIIVCLFLHGAMWWSWSSGCPFAMVVKSSTMGIDHDDDFLLIPTCSRPSCHHHHYLPPHTVNPFVLVHMVSKVGD
jgi:hypothetical protein